MASKLCFKFDPSVCRVCLEDEGQVSLFDTPKNLENFRFITLLGAQKNDGLPQFLCIKCHVRLKVAYQFKTQAISANTQLKTYLSGSNQIYTEISNYQNPFEDIDEEIANFNKEELSDTEKIIVINPEEIDNDEDEDIFAESFDYINEDDEKKTSNSDTLVEFQIILPKNEETNKIKQEIIKKTVSSTRKDKTKNVKASAVNSKFRRVNDLFQCSVCENTFTTELNLNRHMEMHLDKRESYSCQICGKLFTQRSSVRQHLMIHSGERPFACDQCPKTFRRRKTLVGHLKSHKNKQGDYHCEHCGEKFTAHRSLQMHINREHKPTDKSKLPTYPCELCGKIYRSKYSLNDHIISHHASRVEQQKLEVNCKICNKQFLTKAKLTAHMRMHSTDTTKSQPVFKCSECPEVFKSKRTLKMHEEVHTIKEKHECSICGHSFGRKYNLLLHMQEHEQEASDLQYECRKCATKFYNLENLYEHIRGHFNKSSESFKCLYCDDYLVTKSSLKSHIIYSHSDDFKEWNICSLCDLTFVAFEGYYDHMIKNHCVFDGHCKECGADFESIDALNEHSIDHEVLIIN